MSEVKTCARRVGTRDVHDSRRSLGNGTHHGRTPLFTDASRQPPVSRSRGHGSADQEGAAKNSMDKQFFQHGKPLLFINGKISITALIVKGLGKVSLKRPVWGG